MRRGRVGVMVGDDVLYVPHGVEGVSHQDGRGVPRLSSRWIHGCYCSNKSSLGRVAREILFTDVSAYVSLRGRCSVTVAYRIVDPLAGVRFPAAALLFRVGFLS